MNDTNENPPESLQTILSRMGERYFTPPMEGERVEAQAPQDKAPDDRQNLPIATPQATALTTPEYIRSEAFLEVSGFFTPSSNRIENIYVKEKKIREYVDGQGKKRILKTKISANWELGLPVTSDLDYYRAFLKICDEIVDRDGRFQLPITVPTRKLILYAGKSESPKERKEVRQWFKRMTLTGIEGAIYRAKKKDFDDGFVGTVFGQVVMSGETMRNGKPADTNYVWLSPWFLSNYYYRFTRPLDFAFYKQLRKPIAKSLYTLLENGWYAAEGKPYKKSYSALCSEFLLQRFAHISRIKQQLDPSHKELQELELIEAWEYRKAASGTDYVIVYYPGKKFFRDAQEKDTRRDQAERIENGKHNLLPGQATQGDEKSILLEDILTVCGDRQSEAAYRKLINQHPEALIRAAISETRQAHLEGRIIKTRGAYFMDTLKRLAEYRSKVNGASAS
jgi:hypothetical protein